MTGNRCIIINNPELDNILFITRDVDVTKKELIRFLKSVELKDQETLNKFIKIFIENAFKSPLKVLFDSGYKIAVMNSERQTVVHLAFYDECYRIKKRHEMQNFHRTLHSNLYDPNIVSEWLINEMLLENSDLCLDYADIYGLNHLHIACFMGKLELVKKCLNSNNINSSFCHPENLYKKFTPLHFAVINGKSDAVDIVNHLLEHGADSNASDLMGRTPLHLACRLFCDPSEFDGIGLKECLNGEDIIFGRLSMYTSVRLKILDLLLKNGSNIEVMDQNGNTPLLSIFPENYYELSTLNEHWYFHNPIVIPIEETVIKFARLVKAGANVSANNFKGDTILHLILKNLRVWRDDAVDGFLVKFNDIYHCNLVKKVFEIEKKFDVNSMNENSETPLQLAVNYLSYDIVKLLLDLKADISYLKVSWKDKRLFDFFNLNSHLVMVQKLFSIIDLFNSKDYSFSSAAQLAISRLLTHTQGNCNCLEDLYNLLYYGSSSHIVHVLTEPCNKKDLIDFTTYSAEEHLKKMVLGGLFIDQTVKNILKKMIEKENVNNESEKERLQKELDMMKSTNIQLNQKKSTTLYNIMTKDPCNIPQNAVKKFDFNNLTDKYVIYSKIIKGHFTKSMIRRYVFQFALTSVKYLCPLLPDLCCDAVASYLSSEDIVQIFSIAVSSEANETRFFM